MLYLHCGWPKTGTTSLQASLAENRDALAAEGVVFPDRWTQGNNDGHRLLENKGGPGAAITEVRRFVEANSDRRVLISSEVISLRLLIDPEAPEILARLIATVRRVTPVRCIWTLRRFDDLMHSICLHRAKFRFKPSLPEILAELDVDSLFAGMRAMADAADETVYVKYVPSGRYEPELAGALGLTGAAAALADLTKAPRKNVGLSHKQAATLLNLEAVAERCGVELDAGRLREEFEQGTLSFADDRRCQLFDADTRRELHAEALTLSAKYGISAYRSFFEDAELEPARPPFADDPASLSNEDLGRLAAQLSAHAPT